MSALNFHDSQPYNNIAITMACSRRSFERNMTFLLFQMVQDSLNSLLRIGTSSRAQAMRTVAGIPSGPLDLEVLIWRRVWQTFRVENLIGDCGETVAVLTCVVLHFNNIHIFLLNLLTYLTMDLLFGV